MSQAVIGSSPADPAAMIEKMIICKVSYMSEPESVTVVSRHYAEHVNLYEGMYMDLGNQ
jgi:hypothetical protein